MLIEKFGEQHWWPIDKEYHKKNNSDPRFEIITGAILTQNTSWSNVEKALNNLKSENILELKYISDIDLNKLKNLIRPSGFFNQKAKRIQDISNYLSQNYNCDLNLFFNRDVKHIRKELLSLNGIGPETADSILLYAGNKETFVVDAYTKRICKRIPINTGNSYNEIQQYFQSELSKIYGKKDLINVYNELHALIVLFAKKYCNKKPQCLNCPFSQKCKYEKCLL